MNKEVYKQDPFVFPFTDKLMTNMIKKSSFIEKKYKKVMIKLWKNFYKCHKTVLKELNNENMLSN